MKLVLPTSPYFLDGLSIGEGGFRTKDLSEMLSCIAEKWAGKHLNKLCEELEGYLAGEKLQGVLSTEELKKYNALDFNEHYTRSS